VNADRELDEADDEQECEDEGGQCEDEPDDSGIADQDALHAVY
jgi:hypothetical protein